MRKRKMWVGYLFILPSFVGVLLFVLIPYIDVVRRAFMQTASGQFVGLLNFKSILHNKAFLLAFTNTGRFVGVCIPVLFVLSLGIAVSLAKQTAYAEILKTGFVEKQLSALKELQSAEGKVVSPMDGVVSAVNIQVGGMTSGTADILIADISAEMMLKVQFSEENKEHVIVGANAVKTSIELDYLEMPDNTLIDISEIKNYSDTAKYRNGGRGRGKYTDSTQYASDWHLNRCANRDKQKNVFRVYTFRSAASRRGKSILCVYHR